MLKQIIDLSINNSLVSALVAAAIVSLIVWCVKAYRNARDGKLIYEFLVTSKLNSGFDFRSTEAIASHTHLSEDRVAIICASYPKIRRNSKEKQSWVISESVT